MQHRNLIIITVLLSIICSSSCDTLPSDCDRFDNWKIIAEKDKQEICDYQQIYLLDGNYYSICECCECDKGEVVIDCNGEVFCDYQDGCLPDFYANAVYLYSAVEN